MQAEYFFIVQLEEPLLFPTMQDGLNHIEVLKGYREDKYYIGKFLKISADCSIFEFKSTLKASKATATSFHVSILECDLDKIVPPRSVEISFHIDICSVSETDLNKVNAEWKALGRTEMRAEMRAEVFKILDEKLDENESKRIKMDIEKKDICTTDQSIVPVPSVRKGKSNELARTSYIFERLKEFASNYTELEVYDNASRILYSPQRKFSKYSLSRPDITVLMNNKVVVFNPANQRGLVVMTDNNVEGDDATSTLDTNMEGDDATSTLDTNMEGDDATSISRNMDVSSLIVESKLTDLDGTDPIGQVLAGIEETYGVLLYTQLKKRKFGAPLPTDTVMYGMFISYIDNLVQTFFFS